MIFLLVCLLTSWAVPQMESGLAGTSWRLVKFQAGNDRTLVPEDRSKYTMAFDKEGVSVRIDCNRGHGTWKSGGPNQVEFGPMALTRAMCPPAELNDRIPKDWGNVRSYVVKDGHLFLSLMADGGTYEFEPMPKASAEKSSGMAHEHGKPSSSGAEAASPSLENTYWRLTKLGGTPVPPGHGARVAHLILNAEAHRAGGSGGCNGILGEYELEADRLRFPGMAATRMACKEGMDTEKAFLDALNRTTNWKITGHTLDLLDDAGRVLAEFEGAIAKR
jgi:heat shock protein HslJ